MKAFANNQLIRPSLPPSLPPFATEHQERHHPGRARPRGLHQCLPKAADGAAVGVHRVCLPSAPQRGPGAECGGPVSLREPAAVGWVY
jgi:hypothetical protein